MRDSYRFSLQAPAIIIDEFDDLLDTYPYDIQEYEVKGLWSFVNKTVIGLTASLSEGHINLARKMMLTGEQEPVVLEFPSSYQFYSNQPQDASTIVPCANDDVVLLKLLESIDQYYFKKPMICFITAQQKAQIIAHMDLKQWKYYTDSSHEQLQTLKTKDTGVLLLRKQHFRGIDTKFK